MPAKKSSNGSTGANIGCEAQLSRMADAVVEYALAGMTKRLFVSRYRLRHPKPEARQKQRRANDVSKQRQAEAARLDKAIARNLRELGYGC